MLKFGVISEIDAAKGLARVYFEEDDFVSAWLKMSVSRSGIDRVSFPYDVNEHVYCLMDDNWEYGVVCGAIYDEGNLPNNAAGAGILSIHFGDQSAILYNRLTSTFTLDIKGTININCESANIESEGEVQVQAQTVSITAVNTNIEGILNVSGAAVIQGVVSMGGIAGVGGAAVPGDTAELQVKKITATEDVIADTVSLKTHKHTSASAGNPTTGPIP